ncbi:hypothetical protein JJB67_15800 [Clostridium perfringens]|uniref:hypothetical protein n=1 Tax=Clostridium perfringens TaxID=1502 RepID=UPI001ABB1578|nr:hypothetical protein [Clostridium perfringens]MBO3323669.1 hypothetical protein [Clostridium perfringens]MBO3332899.1 hypothetical protein [Clostridium perfringens]MCX0386746.1 hypothetical protein [Clostridium perfringens]
MKELKIQKLDNFNKNEVWLINEKKDYSLINKIIKDDNFQLTIIDGKKMLNKDKLKLDKIIYKDKAYDINKFFKVIKDEIVRRERSGNWNKVLIIFIKENRIKDSILKLIEQLHLETFLGISVVLSLKNMNLNRKYRM